VPKILNRLRLPKYTTAPSSPVSGDVYYNTAENKVYAYNGTSWVDLGATGGGGGGGGGGSTVFFQPTAPSANAVGDIWVQTDTAASFSDTLILYGGIGGEGNAQFNDTADGGNA
jgi:hypothetical protein